MTEPETCGVQGSSQDGYCICIAPAGHWPETLHRCQHGAWYE